jgi:hypothetical protein
MTPSSIQLLLSAGFLQQRCRAKFNKSEYFSCAFVLFTQR